MRAALCNTIRGMTSAVSALALAVLVACGGGDSGPVDPPDPPVQPNRAPVTVGTIAAQSLVVGGEPATIGVSANFSDPDGDALTYSAVSSATGVATASVSGSNVTITPVAEGSATVTVTATDPDGLSANQTIAVSVQGPANQAPVAVGTIDAQTLAVGGDPAAVDVADNFSDPDGDELAYSAASGDEAVATVAVEGSVVTISPVAEGSATVTVTATDPDGLSAEQTIAVSVQGPANQAPVAVGTIDARTLAVGGDPAAVDVAENFSDPDGDSLAYSAASGDEAVATVAVEGSVVTITPVAVGSATVTVTATDPDGLSAEQTIAVSVQGPANQAPVAVGTIDAQTLTVGGNPAAVDVAENFSDPDGDELAYSAASGDEAVATVAVEGSVVTISPVAEGSATVTVTATDPDGLSAEQTIAVSVQSPANQAPVAVGTIDARTLTVGGDPAAVDVAENFSDPDGDELAYSAASGDEAVATVAVEGSMVTISPLAVGSATVTVTATDPDGLSAEQTIAVSVQEPANQAPVAVGTIDARTLTVGGDPAAVDVADNFSDPDGDSLAYSAASGDEAVATVAVEGSIVTISPLAVGSATVTVTATDPDGLSANQTIEVSVQGPANQAPVAVGTIDARTLTVGGDPAAVDVADNFSDPDGDSLAYSAASGDEAVATVAVEGSIVTISPLAVGSATVTVTAADPDGLSANQTIEVSVQGPANQAPVAVGTIDARTLTVGGDPAAVDVAENFSDPDGDSLAYSAASGDEAVATVAVEGSIVTISPLAVGSATVTVTAADPDGLSANQTIEVSVQGPANQAPVAVGTIDARTLTVGGDPAAVDVAENFSDPDGDSLAYSAASGDEAVATVAVEGSIVTISPLAVGSATVTVTAADPDGLSANQTIEVSVQGPANQAPVAVGTIDARTLTVGGDPAAVDVAENFSDPDGDSLAYSAASGDEAVATVAVEGSIVTISPLAVGSATVTVTAADPDGLSANQTIEVSVQGPANQAPVAVGTIDARTLTVGGDPAAVDVAENFSDPDGDSLAYSAASGDEAVATVAVEGSIVTITPMAVGSATVTVTAADPDGLSANQTIEVSVQGPANQAPVAVGTIDARTLTVGGDPAAVDVAENFSDPDGDSLAYSAASGDEAVATVAVEGSIVTITPMAEGDATVTVTAADPGGLSAEQTIAVSVQSPANQAPVAVGMIDDATLPAGGDSLVLSLADLFSDPNGDSLAFSGATTDSTVAEVEAIVDSTSVALVRALGMGNATITLTATDPGGLMAEHTFVVTVEADGDPYWRPLTGVLVFKGYLQIQGQPIVACYGPVVDLVVSGVTYTVHSSKWQRRDNAESEWTDIPDTEKTDGTACPYETDVPGEYRLVGDLTVDGVRGLYRSGNTFTVASGG